MTHSRIANIAAAALLTLATGIAAADDNVLTVSASVTGVCKFNSGTSAIAFGAIDPSVAAGAKELTADVKYRCTTGSGATITAAGGLGAKTMAGSGTAAGENLAYTLSFVSGDTGTGAGFGAGGSDLTLVVKASIAEAAYQVATVGAYSGTVTLTVAP